MPPHHTKKDTSPSNEKLKVKILNNNIQLKSINSQMIKLIIKLNKQININILIKLNNRL